MVMRQFFLLCAAAAIGSGLGLILHFGATDPGASFERGSGRVPMEIATDEDPEPPPRRERTEIANEHEKEPPPSPGKGRINATIGD